MHCSANEICTSNKQLKLNILVLIREKEGGLAINSFHNGLLVEKGPRLIWQDWAARNPDFFLFPVCSV